MPGLDGTGPLGVGQMIGRGFRRCRFAPAHPDVVPSPTEAPESAVPSGENPDRTLPLAPLYGAGRGGIPYGCGRGRVFAGGRRWH